MDRRTFDKARAWLKSLVRLEMSGQLPEGVEVETDGAMGRFRIDISEVYPPLIEGLGGKYDQYWFQVCRRVIANYLKNTYTQPIHAVFTAEDKQKWNYKNLPEGKGEQAGRDEFYQYMEKGSRILDEIERRGIKNLEDV